MILLLPAIAIGSLVAGAVLHRQATRLGERSGGAVALLGVGAGLFVLYGVLALMTRALLPVNY